MEILDAIKKQILYGYLGLKCEHPSIEIESYHEDVYENEKCLLSTGKYVCRKCGKEFSLEEYEKIINNRRQ